MFDKQRHCVLWLALSLLNSRITAQAVANVGATDRLRGSVLITVKDAEGRVPDARVVLLSRPFPADERVGVADRVEVVAGNGEARAHILRGRPYSAWATSASDDGATRMTGVAENVYAGMAVALTAEANTRRPLRLRVVSQEAWAASGPLRIRLRAPTANVEVHEVPLDGETPITVPALPGDRFTVEVLRRDGTVLVSQPQHWSQLAGREVLEVAVDAPRTVRLFVSGTAGRGVAGATILHNDGGMRAHAIGTTRADGTAEVSIPTPRFVRRGSPIVSGTLLVQAAGYAMGVLVPWSSAQAPPPGFSPQWCARLDLADSYAGRWRNGDRPMAGLTLVALCTIKSRTEVSTVAQYRPPVVAYRHVTTTDAEGRFTLPSCSGGVLPVVAAVLSEAQIRALPESWSADGLCPVVFGACGGSALQDDLDVRALEPIDLRVQQPDGLPAALAHIDFVPERFPAEPVADLFARIGLHADRQGRLRILRGSEVFALYARLDGASALVDVVSATHPDHQHVQTVPIPLRPKIELRGSVVTADGKPAARAPLMIGVFVDRALGPAGSNEADFGRVDPTRARAVAIRDPVRVVRLLGTLGMGSSRAVPVDQDGTFKCAVDDIPDEFEFQCATGLMQGTPLGRVRPREQPTKDLRLVLP